MQQPPTTLFRGSQFEVSELAVADLVLDVACVRGPDRYRIAVQHLAGAIRWTEMRAKSSR